MAIVPPKVSVPPLAQVIVGALVLKVRFMLIVFVPLVALLISHYTDMQRYGVAAVGERITTSPLKVIDVYK